MTNKNDIKVKLANNLYVNIEIPNFDSIVNLSNSVIKIDSNVTINILYKSIDINYKNIYHIEINHNKSIFRKNYYIYSELDKIGFGFFIRNNSLKITAAQILPYVGDTLAIRNIEYGDAIVEFLDATIKRGKLKSIYFTQNGKMLLYNKRKLGKVVGNAYPLVKFNITLLEYKM